MLIMVFKHPHKYGLMAMISQRDNDKFDLYRESLNPFVKFFMEKDFFCDVAPQHISLCYFSYPDKYPKEYVKKLVPKIIDIIKDKMPLKIKVKGLSGWWELNLGVPALVWNITDLGEIPRIKDKIINELSKDIAHFNDIEFDFIPHIGVAWGNEENKEEIKKIIDQSKKNPEIELEIDRFFIFYPEGPEKIYPSKD